VSYRELHWVHPTHNVWETEERVGDYPEFRIVTKRGIHRMRHHPDTTWVPYNSLRDVRIAASLVEHAAS
jgi:hypothetical protein